MSRITFYKGEKRPLKLRVSINGVPRDMSLDTLELGVKRHLEDADYIIHKLDADFNKSQAGQAVISVLLDETDTAEVGLFRAQVKMTEPGGDVLKTKPFEIEVVDAVVI